MRMLFLASFCLALASCGKIVPIEAGDGGATTVDGGSGDSGSGTDASIKAPCDAPIAFEDLTGCLAEAQCQQLVRCTPSFLDLDECRANVFSVFGDFDDQFRIFADAIAAGKANYDPNAAFTCLQSFTTASCSSDGGQDEECEAVFRGTTAPGGACLEEFECAAIGSRCNSDQCQMQCCLGVCSSPVDVGQSCNFDSCKPGDQCVRDGTSNDFFCRAGDNGSPCEQSSDCDTDFFCEPGQLICVPTRPLDAACASPDECTGDVDCVNGKCQRVDTLGAPCQDFCLGSLSCEGETNRTCVAVPGAGEDCDVVGQCNSITLDCFSIIGTPQCVPKQGEGAPCGQRECQPGLICEADLPSPPGLPTCILPQANNATCNRDQQCASHLCEQGGTGPGTCVEPVDCYASMTF